jgi:peptidoglycan/xylan/chitin deacetylase (PgdA/CDA1 family)
MVRRGVRIITYHYVRDIKETRFPSIKALSLEGFERQLRWIKNNGVAIGLDQLLRAYNGSSRLPGNSYLLTFDDAYIDHYESVFPLLREYKMSGVFFVPIKAVVERELLDVNKIQFVLAGESSVRKIIDDIYAKLEKYRAAYQLKSNEEYWSRCAKEGRFDGPDVKFVKNMLQFELPEAVRREITDDLFSEYVSSNQREFADKLYMTPDNIGEMKESGMVIGSHGYDHGWLGSMTRKEQAWDIRKAKTYFKDVGIEKESWVMCYPYGSYNKDTKQILEKLGCQAAFTTRGGVAKVEREKRYEINRMDTNELVAEVSEQTAKLGQA